MLTELPQPLEASIFAAPGCAVDRAGCLRKNRAPTLKRFYKAFPYTNRDPGAAGECKVDRLVPFFLLVAEATDYLIDLCVGQPLTSLEQHFSQVFFAFKAAGMTDVA